MRVRVRRTQLVALRALALVGVTILAAATVALLAQRLPDVSSSTAATLPASDGAALADPAFALHHRSSSKKSPFPRPHGIHVVVTCNGAPYVNWQVRIMYKSFLDVAQRRGSDLKHFTRVLHRQTPDELATEIPTLRVDPPTPQCDTRCEFPVAERPAAIRQWLQTPDSYRGAAILLAESDYVFNEPIGLPPGTGEVARGYFYDYINPTQLPSEISQRFGSQIDPALVPRTGPAPTLLTRSQLEKIQPFWEEGTNMVENDSQLKLQLGWVREMYAFSFALKKANVKVRLLTTEMLSQPPKDEHLSPIFHYTWASEFRDPANGYRTVWHFEKREYVKAEHLRKPKWFKIDLPPADADSRGLTTTFPRDGVRVSKQLLDAITAMISRINWALDELSDLPHPGCGWEEGEPPCNAVCEADKLCRQRES